MDMECLITLDDAVAALHAQLNAPSHRFAALISSCNNVSGKGVGVGSAYAID